MAGKFAGWHGLNHYAGKRRHYAFPPFTGAWALHRLLKEGAIRQSGNKATARFVVSGREVTYQLTFDTLDNPFTILSQLKFACPSDL